jgi:hypothetical protein
MPQKSGMLSVIRNAVFHLLRQCVSRWVIKNLSISRGLSFISQLITRYIDDVEALGDIGAVNMDEIAKALSKNRGL